MTRARLAEGVYEHLITEQLARRLEELDADRIEKPLDEADAHVALGQHLGAEIARYLGSLPREDRVERARALAARVLEQVAEAAQGDAGDELRDQRPAAPARRLFAVHRGAVPERPSSPLATSTLLTRNKAEPALGHELAREITTADRIDAIIAFVTVGGVRAIHEALTRFVLRPGVKLRVLTTTFTGVTQIAALDTLARLPGAEVRISYDTQRTRLHAKAWLFHRNTGLTTAYVGSANLTSTALGSGQEWMVKLCAADMPHVIEKFEGTFETLWADKEFERYAPDDIAHRTRLQAALANETRSDEERTVLVTLEPRFYQQEILDKLAAERAIHGRTRNLVVAATGTGKTVIAALDYVAQMKGGVPPRLLFLAHRKELLQQARQTFRHALQDASFGELLVGGEMPQRWDYVFASIQSAQTAIERLGPEHFQHVIVDECHHAPAKSYQEVIGTDEHGVPRLKPRILVGLTATPERSDNVSLLPDFGGHIAAELRLWHALDAQLLVPFEYYGISDGVDLRKVRWTRTGYDVGALGEVYTGHTARADLIRHQLAKRVADPRAIRALGFCVSIEHAKFMAESFTAAGLPARAVFGDSDDRDEAPALLRERAVNVLFTCDLYNEGVDLPFVDTLLFLRPTQSATLFLQQLGRGLRLAPGKSSCLVLDFIGQHRDEFRFDTTLSAATGIPRARLRKAVEEGFPYLPAGCAFQLDTVAREAILRSLKATLAGAKRLANDLRELSEERGHPSLSTFLSETGRDVEEVYEAGGWTTLQRRAGLVDIPANEVEETEELSRRLGWLQHIDEPERLRSYSSTLATAKKAAPQFTDLQRRQMLMLDTQLQHRGVLRAAEQTATYLASKPAIVREFEELREVLEDRVSVAAQVRPVADWSLALHRHYSRREIAAGVGFVHAGDKSPTLQGGILQLKDVKRELLFVTLDKSGKDFSPTTRYRDYAISRDLFHWETQGAASVSRPSGRRYLDSATNGWSFYLFVRTDPEATFAFLGPIEYVSHSGDRPIGITWRLTTTMPASLYEQYATLRPG